MHIYIYIYIQRERERERDYTTQHLPLTDTKPQTLLAKPCVCSHLRHKTRISFVCQRCHQTRDRRMSIQDGPPAPPGLHPLIRSSPL